LVEALACHARDCGFESRRSRLFFQLIFTLLNYESHKEFIMWCLETIIQLNQKAMELAAQNKPIQKAYAAVGINAFIPKDKRDGSNPFNPIKVVASINCN